MIDLLASNTALIHLTSANANQAAVHAALASGQPLLAVSISVVAVIGSVWALLAYYRK